MDFRVSFFRLADKEESKDEFLGSVVVSDHGLDVDSTIMGRAFRQATSVCLTANKVTVERV